MEEEEVNLCCAAQLHVFVMRMSYTPCDIIMSHATKSVPYVHFVTYMCQCPGAVLGLGRVAAPPPSTVLGSPFEILDIWWFVTPKRPPKCTHSVGTTGLQ